tara:strand:- start:956 stop:2452 length:1497 start_codon:yes stop_codon:yes gene_type:complete
MVENIINKFLYTGAAPGEKLATQQAVKNMSYGQIGKNIVDEGGFGYGKNLRGYDPNYTGKGAIPRNTAFQKMMAPLKYSAGAYNLGDKASNLAGGTPGQRQLYEKVLQSPVSKAASGIMNFAPKALTTLASLPAQAAFFTLGSTPANASEANMSPEDFRALAEAEGMTYGSSPITSSSINLDERYADQLAPGAYGKMGENVYTKMDDGSTRMDPYASQKFYDDAIFNDYFATNRYEDFSPRVGRPDQGIFGAPQIGDAISRTNVQGRDLEADLGMRINPDIQPSQNIFQRAGNAIQGGLGSMRDFAGKGIDLGKMAISGIGNAIMPGLGFVGNLLSGIDRFDTLSPEDQAFILEQAGGNRPAKDPFGINIRSARGNYADYVRNKGIYAKGKRGDYYRSISNFNPQQIATLQRERKAKRAYEKQIKDAADAASRNAARARSITAGYGGSDDSRGATGPTASGAGMGVGGGYASDYGFKKDGGMIGYRDGGVASMFVRRR